MRSIPPPTLSSQPQADRQHLERRAGSRWAREIAWTVGAAAIVLAFGLAGFLMRDGFFWQDDFQSQYLPASREIARALSEGDWPIFSDSCWFGASIAGEFQHGVFWLEHPGRQLVRMAARALASGTATVLALTHLAILAAGAFRLARDHGLAPHRAILVAVIAALNGWLVCWGKSTSTGDYQLRLGSLVLVGTRARARAASDRRGDGRCRLLSLSRARRRVADHRIDGRAHHRLLGGAKLVDPADVAGPVARRHGVADGPRAGRARAADVPRLWRDHRARCQRGRLRPAVDGPHLRIGKTDGGALRSAWTDYVLLVASRWRLSRNRRRRSSPTTSCGGSRSASRQRVSSGSSIARSTRTCSLSGCTTLSRKMSGRVATNRSTNSRNGSPTTR